MKMKGPEHLVGTVLSPSGEKAEVSIQDSKLPALERTRINYRQLPNLKLRGVDAGIGKLAAGFDFEVRENIGKLEAGKYTFVGLVPYPHTGGPGASEKLWGYIVDLGAVGEGESEAVEKFLKRYDRIKGKGGEVRKLKDEVFSSVGEMLEENDYLLVERGAEWGKHRLCTGGDLDFYIISPDNRGDCLGQISCIIGGKKLPDLVASVKFTDFPDTRLFLRNPETGIAEFAASRKNIEPYEGEIYGKIRGLGGKRVDVALIRPESLRGRARDNNDFLLREYRKANSDDFKSLEEFYQTNSLLTTEFMKPVGHVCHLLDANPEREGYQRVVELLEME